MAELNILGLVHLAGPAAKFFKDAEMRDGWSE
jgi:hypothetical protein